MTNMIDHPTNVDAPNATRGKRLPTWAPIVPALVIALVSLCLTPLFFQRGFDEARREAGTIIPADAPPIATAPALATTSPTPDWREVVNSILAFDFWLQQHPRADLVAQIVDPSNARFLAEGQDFFAKLASGEYHYTAGPYPRIAEVVRLEDDATCATTAGPTPKPCARLYLKFAPSEHAEVGDRSGRTISPAPTEGEARWVLHYSDGLWRLYA